MQKGGHYTHQLNTTIIIIYFDWNHDMILFLQASINDSTYHVALISLTIHI